MLPVPEQPEVQEPAQEVEKVFADYEARTNIVGLFDLLLKIDRRVNPHLYEFQS